MNTIKTNRTHAIMKMVGFYVLLFVLVYSNTMMAEAQMKSNCCNYWKSKVSEAIPTPERSSEKHNSESESILAAIECLLTMEGDKSRARFSGATRFDTSQTFEPATSDVGALYYISFLYLKKWDHSNAVALVDKDNRLNHPESISIAYRAYRKWFKKIKDEGITKAREQKLDPLEGTGIRWY
ncbi:MAG TPA: hypothetical protein PLD38_15835 [Pyrinomonadaceae bacterium]|nr:hypothetical protein [Chloracidobacterium sp.]HQY68746.1 hypothetical protein [Pyrinomonadaceae bacterium]MBK7804062.1 hypothetical protein [Chloracidobacterium sp.]MBK9439268.1 hypothetical protein [Chloracidobacterium sp.]MBK9768764.1 hypothetical protein [Chloracidobacterium sp.]